MCDYTGLGLIFADIFSLRNRFDKIGQRKSSIFAKTIVIPIALKDSTHHSQNASGGLFGVGTVYKSSFRYHAAQRAQKIDETFPNELMHTTHGHLPKSVDDFLTLVAKTISDLKIFEDNVTFVLSNLDLSNFVGSFHKWISSLR